MNNYYKQLMIFLVVVSLSGCNSTITEVVEEVDEPEVIETYVLENISEERPLFGEGLLPVRDGEKWGYVDKEGKFVIEPKFALAHTFRSNGLAIVATQGGNRFGSSGYGVIDKTGSWVIEPKADYYSIELLNNGVYYVNSNVSGDIIFDRSGFEIFSESKFNLAIRQNEEIVDKYEYNSWSDIEFGLDMFVANISYANGERACGYLNMDSEWVIEPKFTRCYGFGPNGLAMVSVDPESVISNFGFINTAGEFVIQPKTEWGIGAYESIFNKDGFVNVTVHDNETRLTGVIDSSGNYIIEPKYFQLSNFVDNLAVTYDERSQDLYNYTFKYGVIDINGNVIVKEGLYDQLGPISNGYILYIDKKSNKVGYLNYEGEIAIKAQFQSKGQTLTISFEDFDQMTGRFMDDGYAVVILNDKLNVIDESGKIMFENGFDEIYEYDENYDPYNVIRFNND